MHEGVVKFWMNDQRMSQKTLKLVPLGGPWIPCIKIGKEKNCLSLNPFARQPSSFYEASVDRTSSLDTLLMPHLENSLCVTNLPQIEAKSEEETAKVLNQLFQHSQTNISAIHMPEPGSENMFCFIKFHHYTNMVEFLEKHRPSGKFQIYEAHQILEWFIQDATDKAEPELDGGVPRDLKAAFQVIKKAISIPVGRDAGQLLEMLKTAYASLNTPSSDQPALVETTDDSLQIRLTS